MRGEQRRPRRDLGPAESYCPFETKAAGTAAATESNFKMLTPLLGTEVFLILSQDGQGGGRQGG